MSSASQLAGVFGGPLALVEGLVGACASYLAVRPSGEIFLYQRAPKDVEHGDTWIELGYDDSSASGRRTSQDAALSGFEWDRRIVVSLVRAADFAQETEKRDLVNLASSLTSELLAADATLAIRSVRLEGFFFDSKTDPKLIGARIHLEL